MHVPPTDQRQDMVLPFLLSSTIPLLMKTLRMIFNHKKIQFIVNIPIDCNKIVFCEEEAP
ncbi:hypothetical protein AF331_11240 [Rossellomorea marisflavi]|uniref:Uncharacterized protein n=1 Tax=Rossellomorea marisflavi TaxID=189381 RepID=A0A0J5V962_9BACI|nr:hypothetical protein VL12_08575 [Rossellomorea marisflavi]KON84608.1 hypothetical protein AF331_11240 [Rossellomorea marisflavi]